MEDFPHTSNILLINAGIQYAAYLYLIHIRHEFFKLGHTNSNSKPYRMRNHMPFLTISITLFFMGVSLSAQNYDKPLLKKDSMERDNTRMVKEKNIPDTSKKIQNDTTTQKNKSNKNLQNNDMYVVPNKEKKNSDK